MQLFQNHLEIGDTIIFENKNGFYHKQQVKSLQIEGESITNTKKMSTTQPIIVGIKVSKKIPNTAVIYKFIKKTTSKMKKKID